MMTEQYQQNNINNPRGSREVDVDSILNLDDDLVVVDSSLAPITLTLPNAIQIPANVVNIKTPTANANPVTIIGFSGQTIDGAANLILDALNDFATLESDGANWQLFAAGSGPAGGFPETQDEGIVVVASTETYDFVGTGVTVAGAGSKATVTIPGGSLPPLFSFAFVDSGITLVVPALGPDTNGLYSVEANISQAGGLSTSYIITLAVSSTGVDASVLEVRSDLPVTTVSIDAIISAGTVILRLTGLGAGASSTINYRIPDTIVRAFP